MTSYLAACCCSVDPEPVCDAWATFGYSFSIVSSNSRGDFYDFSASGTMRLRYLNSVGRFATQFANIPIEQPTPDIEYSMFRDRTPFPPQTRTFDDSRPVELSGSIRHGFGLQWFQPPMGGPCSVSLGRNEYGMDASFNINVPYLDGSGNEGIDTLAAGRGSSVELRTIGDEEDPCDDGTLAYARGGWVGSQIATGTFSDCDAFIPGSYSLTTTNPDGSTLSYDADVSWSISDVVFYAEEPPL